MDPLIINPYNLSEEFRMCTYPSVMPDIYSISSHGRLFNCISGKILAQHVNNGYYVTSIKRTDGTFENFKIHRLVAWEFVPYRRNFNIQVNHIDGNKLNNYYENLEWVTPLENTHHAVDKGLRPLHGSHNKLTYEIAHYICQLLTNPNNSYAFIVDQVEGEYGINICPGTVKAIARGEIWSDVCSHYDIPHRTKSFGEGHSNSKLTEQDVHFICQQRELGLTVYEIADLLNNKVSVPAIRSIVNGDNWKHISSQYNLTPNPSNMSGVGVFNRNSKLTEDDVRFIREQYSLGKTPTQIADLINADISLSTIKGIVYNKSWKHLL